MICNRYRCFFKKVSRSLGTRTCVWHAKQHKWGRGSSLVVSVQLWLWCYFFGFCGEKKGNCGVFHALFTLEMHWDPLHIIHVRASRLRSRLNARRTAEWHQMIFTTGKYLWAEKSNSGSAWRRTGWSSQPPSLELKFTDSARKLCVTSPWYPFYVRQQGASWPQCWVWPPSVCDSPANNQES